MAAAVRPEADALARLASRKRASASTPTRSPRTCSPPNTSTSSSARCGRSVSCARDETRKIIEIAEPFGVVAAIVPSTNPTSTAIYKILIALKARCAIVISPHPSAARCISRTAEIMAAAAARAGAPPGRHRLDDHGHAGGHAGIDAATRGRGHPGNRRNGPGARRLFARASRPTAWARQRARATSTSRPTSPRPLATSSSASRSTTACSARRRTPSSPTRRSPTQVEREPDGQRRPLPDRRRAQKLARAPRHPAAAAEPGARGQAGRVHRRDGGVDRPAGHARLIAALEGVGRDYPLSIEKLCPVLSYYVVSDWREGCERCKQILRYGGMGHTMSIHSQTTT